MPCCVPRPSALLPVASDTPSDVLLLLTHHPTSTECHVQIPARRPQAIGCVDSPCAGPRAVGTGTGRHAQGHQRGAVLWGGVVPDGEHALACQGSDEAEAYVHRVSHAVPPHACACDRVLVRVWQPVHQLHAEAQGFLQQQ